MAYLKGQRQRYVGPVQLFLFANVLFFAVQSLTHVKIFATSLASHLHNQDWSRAARPLVARRVEALHTTIDAYAPLFDQAVELHAKSLIILMAVPVALLQPFVFYKSRRPFVVHLVFALHLYTFLLLLFCLALVVAAIDELLGGRGMESRRMDLILSASSMIACAAYLYVATGTAYGARGAKRVLKVLVLTAAVAVMVLGYRFLLFLITLYST